MNFVDTFIGFLQASISPIALISGVGLILLSLTNRLARTIDRSRQMVVEIEKADEANKKNLQKQLGILFKRSKILRNSIVAISFSILCSSLIIPIILLMKVSDLDLRYLGILFFLMSIASIILSAIFLFVDVSLTLKALNCEVSDYLEK